MTWLDRFILTILLVIFAGILFIVIAQPHAEAGCTAAWNDDFRKAARTFMPAPVKRHWKWVKAQTIVESSCRADVCSHVGACGALQIMPDTWRELTGRDPGTSIFQPKLNIVNGTRYQAWQVRQWLGRPRSPVELYELALGGYNAGLGHILEAQRRCGGARTWPDIAVCLPVVTGEHATETRNYVRRWHRWRKRLGD